jgi:predicted acylesterase/phospholipase RssA
MMNRALVLAGGGARGSYQVGMLEELIVNKGLDFQTIRGVSVGALNAAFLAQAPAKPDPQAELTKRVRDLKDLWTKEIAGNNSVYSKRTGGLLGMAAGADSLYCLDPLKRLIEKHISLQALRTSGRNFAVGTVSLVSGLYEESDPATGDDFMQKLVASASIPVVFPFVDLKEKKDVLVDGGARNITPLSSVFKAKKPPVDEIYVLLTSRIIRRGKELPTSATEENDYSQWKDNWLGTKVDGLDVLKRTLDIITDEVYLGDLREAIRWNTVAESIKGLEAAAHGQSSLTEGVKRALDALLNVKRRSVPLHVLAPRQWFDEDNTQGSRNSSTEFSPELIRKAIAHGSEVAKDRKLWLWPPA